MTVAAKMQVAIVDDEPLARARLRRLLGKAAGGSINVVYEAADPEALLEAAAAVPVDLVFLDIEMPGGDGFSALRRWPGSRPHIVFVTAHEHYGADAFGVRALDYLLKPVSLSRLAETLDRASEAIGRGSGSPGEPTRMISLGLAGRRERVAIDSIDFIVARRNYLELNVGKRQYVMRRALHDFHASLTSGDFVRLHRSIVVRRSAVCSIRSAGSGRYWIELKGGQRLQTGRSYRKAVQALLIGSPPVA